MSGALVTARIAGRGLAIPVDDVEDVLGPQALTPVPLSPPEVAGVLNLRGRIVTALDLGARMGLRPAAADDAPMCIVVAREGALYGLLVDSVGDVLEPPPEALVPTPRTLDRIWRELSTGVCRLGDGLVVVLDVDRLLGGPGRAAMIGDNP